jgi:hypothetical protein
VSVQVVGVALAEEPTMTAFEELSAGTARKYVMVSGKGGVGKTSLAASLAVKFAAAGHPTLVVSTDPAHSLSDSLDQVWPPAPHVAPSVWIPGDDTVVIWLDGCGTPISVVGRSGPAYELAFCPLWHLPCCTSMGWHVISEDVRKVGVEQRPLR